MLLDFFTITAIVFQFFIILITLKERSDAKKELTNHNKRWQNIMDEMDVGFVLLEQIEDEDKYKYKFLMINNSCFCMLQDHLKHFNNEQDIQYINLNDILNHTFEEIGYILPQDIYDKYTKVLAMGKTEYSQHFCETCNQWTNLICLKVNSNKIAVLCNNITELKNSQNDLETIKNEIKKQNIFDQDNNE